MTEFWGNKNIEEILENDELFEKKSLEISEGLKSKIYDISQVVEALGITLTSTLTPTRLLGTKFLSTCLEKLPSSLLDLVQVNFMTDFYCDRLKDHHTVIPNVLIGLLALTKMDNLSEENSRKILNSIFLHVPCQSQLREERENIYNIIKGLAAKFTKDLQNQGVDFVKGVIGAIEGERDPRNLMFIFTYMPHFIDKFPLGILSEEMFEVFECYFPIDFHPTNDDPASITRDILAGELANCLCADESFSEKCFELALEKLDSDLIVAKLDSLFLLKMAVQKFQIKHFDKEFEKLWAALRIEVLPGNTKEITAASLDLIQATFNASTNENTITDNMLRSIFDSILAHLADTENRLFQSSLNIVLKILDCENTYSKIWIGNKIMTLFLSGISGANEIKYQILDLIEKTLDILMAKKVLIDLNGEMLMNTQTELITFLELNDNKVLQKSLNCLEKISEFIIVENRITIYCKINQIIHLENDIDILIIPFIVQFATYYPEEVYMRIVKSLLENNIKQSTSAANTIEVFKLICALINVEFFTNYCINFIMQQIFDHKNFAILDIFNAFLCNQNKNKDLENILYKKYHIIQKSLEFVRNSKIDTNNLLKLSKLLNSVIQTLATADQIEIVEKYLKQLKLEDKNDFFIASGILGSLSPNTNLSEYFETLVTDLTNIALTTDDDKIKETCHHIICSLVNKSPDTELHKNTIKKIVLFLKKEIEKNDKRAVELLSWIAKGLLMKGDNSAAEIIEDLAHLLEHPTLSTVAVLAFDILSVEFPQLHLPVVKYLFKQKLFHICLSKIINKLEKYSMHHLTAFAYVLKISPHSVVKSNLKTLGPILFQCLNLDSVKPILIALEIINKLIEEKDEYFAQFLSKLISELLKLSVLKDAMNIRMLALNILANIPTVYPTVAIVPFKHDVLYGLIPCIDDHKRLVRSVAVRARSIWFVV